MDEEHDRFKNGDCWRLAIELHKRTGWPLWVLADECSDEGVLGWFHVGVKHPDGRYVDIDGAQSFDELYDAWEWYFEGNRDATPGFESGLFDVTLDEILEFQDPNPVDDETKDVATMILRNLSNDK